MVSLPEPRTIVAVWPKHEFAAPESLGSVSAVAVSPAVNEAKIAMRARGRGDPSLMEGASHVRSASTTLPSVISDTRRGPRIRPLSRHTRRHDRGAGRPDRGSL